MSEKKGKGCLIAAIIFLIFIVFTIILFFSVKSALNPMPTVKDNSVLIINLKGEIPEYSEQKNISDFLKPKILSFADMYKILKYAAKDKKIKGIYLKISNPTIGFAKIQELLNLLNEFKKSGKFVYSYIDVSSENGYWISLPSDKIVMPESGYLEINGFKIGNMYFKELLSKLGIEAEVVNIGKYKSFGDIFKRKNMSEADREQLTLLLDNIYNTFVKDVSKFRKFDKNYVKNKIEEGIFLPEKALKSKFIDEITYEDKFLSKIKDFSKIEGIKYLKTIPHTFSTKKIAVVFVDGGIGMGRGGYDPLMGKVVGSDEIIKIFKKIRKDKRIKGVVLRINSPGGSATASDLIWREIRKTDEVKPVIASMSNVAASGGYYLSVACRKIVADPLTITGSIGVVSIIFNLENLYKKVGINVEILKKGKWADFPTGNRALTEEEWKKFREGSESFYKIFVNKVAKGRRKSFDEIDKVARGRVWSGKDAHTVGLVDSLGGLEEAIELAKNEARIGKNEKVGIIFYPKKKKLFDIIAENLENSEKIIFNRKGLREKIIENFKKYREKSPYLYLMENKIEVE